MSSTQRWNRLISKKTYLKRWSSLELNRTQKSAPSSQALTLTQNPTRRGYSTASLMIMGRCYCERSFLKVNRHRWTSVLQWLVCNRGWRSLDPGSTSNGQREEPLHPAEHHGWEQSWQGLDFGSWLVPKCVVVHQKFKGLNDKAWQWCTQRVLFNSDSKIKEGIARNRIIRNDEANLNETNCF